METLNFTSPSKDFAPVYTVTICQTGIVCYIQKVLYRTGLFPLSPYVTYQGYCKADSLMFFYVFSTSSTLASTVLRCTSHNRRSMLLLRSLLLGFFPSFLWLQRVAVCTAVWLPLSSQAILAFTVCISSVLVVQSTSGV